LCEQNTQLCNGKTRFVPQNPENQQLLKMDRTLWSYCKGTSEIFIIVGYMSISSAGVDYLGHTFKLYYMGGLCGITFMHLVTHLFQYITREETWMEVLVW
jgi:uncharacterized membrane protein YdcZ (DUF606 family)